MAEPTKPDADRRTWNTEPTIDHPVGPDDAGNVVMHGIGMLVSAARWVRGKLTRR